MVWELLAILSLPQCVNVQASTHLPREPINIPQVNTPNIHICAALCPLPIKTCWIVNMPCPGQNMNLWPGIYLINRSEPEMWFLIKSKMTIIVMQHSITDNPRFQIRTWTTRTPAFWGYPLLRHDYPYHWVILDPKSKEGSYKFKEFAKLSNFLILKEILHGTQLLTCANMTWIWRVLLRIQRGHDSVHRQTYGQTDGWTDGQGETSIPPFWLRWNWGYNNW